MTLPEASLLHHRYRVEQTLHTSNAYRFYRALDLCLDTPCLVKENLNLSAQGLEHFTFQAQTLARLRHPNLPRVLDFDFEGQYLVLDWTEGPTLQQLLEQNGALPASQALICFRQICTTLAYLHSRQPWLIHRAICPQNIVITPDGDAILLGFSHLKSGNPDIRLKFEPAATFPGFSPPEQAAVGMCDPRSDIYAAAATLYNLLTGQPPAESTCRLLGDVLTRPAFITPEISPYVETLILRALDLDLNQRFQKVEDMLIFLESGDTSIGLEDNVPEDPDEEIVSLGEVLNNRYRIMKLIDQDPGGNTYLAIDTQHGGQFEIIQNTYVSPDAQQQFTTESTLLLKLRHPNLQRVVDYFVQADGAQNLVFEYVDGEPLSTRLEATGEPLPLAQVITWMIELCDAVSYMHAHRPPLLHRDIKPANIRLRPNGRICLVDYSISKFYAPESPTLPWARAVSRGFSPPEQYGSGETDPVSDIYSIGATMYNLLTGVAPVESIQRLISDPMHLPREINHHISPQMEKIVLRAMEIDPDNRFQQVREIKEKLAAL